MPPSNPVRRVTATSLFDGHDASINIVRRILQSQGAEVVHLGHNRSVQEVVDAAVEEDVQGVAVSSYQDRKSTRLNSSHANISYAVFCLKKKNSKHTALN